MKAAISVNYKYFSPSSHSQLGKTIQTHIYVYIYIYKEVLAWRGIYFSCCFFLASWLFGFLSSWLLGFLASRLLGFLACWLWLVASSAFPVPLRQVAFWLSAFGGFGFSHPLLSQFLSGRFCFCTLSLFFLDLASRIISITSCLPI